MIYGDDLMKLMAAIWPQRSFICSSPVCNRWYTRCVKTTRLVRQYLPVWRYLHTYVHVHTSCSIFTSKWRLIGYKGVDIFMLNIALFITYIIRNAECIKWIFDLYVHVIHKIRQLSARIDFHDTEYSESKVFYIMMYTKLQTPFKDKPTVITHKKTDLVTLLVVRLYMGRPCSISFCGYAW